MFVSYQWKVFGAEAIRRGDAQPKPLPWIFHDTVFKCAWEYPVADFESEVGFYIETLGFTTIALDETYALFTTPDADLTFACRRREDSPQLSGHILCFMTKNIDAFAQALAARLPEGAVTRRFGSSIQTVLGIRSPAGLQIDIWEDPDMSSL